MPLGFLNAPAEAEFERCFRLSGRGAVPSGCDAVTRWRPALPLNGHPYPPRGFNVASRASSTRESTRNLSAKRPQVVHVDLPLSPRVAAVGEPRAFVAALQHVQVAH